jgi:hypothetical protein
MLLIQRRTVGDALAAGEGFGGFGLRRATGAAARAAERQAAEITRAKKGDRRIFAPVSADLR